MRNVTVDMIVRGLKVRKINHLGGTYLPVAEGDEFSIRIYNGNPERVVAIVSVDGRSVMNGEPASHNDSGYVIDGYDSVTIEGYRRGNEAVKTFVVGSSDRSYASKREGSDSPNNGVIGVVIKPEKMKRIPTSPPVTYPENPYKRGGPEWNLCNVDCEIETTAALGLVDDAEPRNLRSRRKSLASGSSVGTQMGREKVNRVMEVQFDADENRKSVIVLYYDTVESLQRRGIPVRERLQAPNAFPAQPNGMYTPDA